MASVTAKMFGYTRNVGNGQGRFPIPPAPAFFVTGDWIDVDCTPRDASGAPTSNHPSAIEWYYTSGGDGVLVDQVDYVVVDDDTFTPQVQIRFNTRTGYIDMWCKVSGYESNHLHLEVHYIDPNA